MHKVVEKLEQHMCAPIRRKTNNRYKKQKQKKKTGREIKVPAFNLFPSWPLPYKTNLNP